MDTDNIDPIPGQENAEPEINLPDTEQQETVASTQYTVPSAQVPEEAIVGKKKTSFFTPSVLNIILILLLVVLYVLFFTHSFRQPKTQAIPEAVMYQKKGGLTIAFVNSDSIKTHYQLVKDLQKNLEDKYASLNKDITARQNALQVKAGELQRKYEARQISNDEAQKMDEMLKAEGKKLYDLNQEYSNKMSDEEYRLNTVYIDSMNNYLVRFNKKYNFDYILGYSKGGGILYARDTLDITKYVLEGLNEEYYTKYPESKKKAK